MKRLSLLFVFSLLMLLCVSSTQGQTDTIKSEMHFDLGITRDMNINLWPIFKRYKTKESNELQVVFPIFKYKRYYKNPSKSSHFFPIYWSDSSSKGKDLRLLSFYYPSIFRISKDFERNTSSFKFVELVPEINFMEVTKSADGLFVQNNMLFMLWFKNDLALHRSHFIFFPVYWSFNNPQYSTHTIFPLTSWGTYNQNKENYFAITPIYWHFNKTDGYRNVLFPLWWNRMHASDNNKTYTNLFAPLYWSLRDNERNNKVLFPIIWKFKNSRTNSFTFAPILSWGKSYNTNNSYLVVTPIFWHFSRENSSSNILFPLLWNNRYGSGKDAVSNTLLFPIYWSHQDERKNNKVLFPIIWSLRNPTYHSFTFAPLFSAGHSTDSTRNHIIVTPLIWHFKKGESTRNVLFPIWWYKNTGQGEYSYRSNIIFPLYWSFVDIGVKTQILFPIVWNLKNENYSSFTFAPLFSSGRSASSNSGHLIITPLFWHFQNGDNCNNVLFPIWWYSNKGVGNNRVYSNILFPIYFRVKDKLNDNTIVFPIHWSLKNPKYHSYTFFPFYSSGSSTNGAKAHLIVTPLYWRFTSGENRKSILFPVWFNTQNSVADKENNFKVIFPFYWAYKDKSKNNEVLFPIIWNLRDTLYNKLIVVPLFSGGHSKDNKYGYLMVTPLYWHFKINEGYRNILFPIWWNKKRGTGDKLVYSNLIIPFYWANKNKHNNNKVVFPIIWSIKNTHYSSLTVAPIFSKGISSDSTKTHLAITPLFWQFRNGYDYKNVLFPIWWDTKRSFGKDAEYNKVLFPLYWSHKNRWENNKVLFPIVWSLNNDRYKSFTFAPIFSIGHSTDSIRSHFVCTPLFWHFNNRNRKSDVLFPIFWSFKNNQTSTSILFPIVWNFKNPDYSSYNIIPLISIGHSIDGTWRHFVATPLFWNIIRGDDKDRFFIPIWWYHKRGSGEEETRSNIVLPIYWSHKDSYKNFAILFPLVWSFKNSEYQSFTFAPLFSFGHSTENRREHAVVTPLFWHFKNLYSSHNILFPIYWNSKKGIGEKAKYTNVLFPIYLSVRDEKKNNRILFPIVWNLNNSKYSSTTVLPLFSFGHSPDFTKKHLVVTPLFWKIQRTEYKKVLFFPFYSHYTDITGKSKNSSLVFIFRHHKEKDRKTVSIIWPICEFTKDVNYRYFRFAPIIWYKNAPTSRYFSIQPFYLQVSDSTSKSYYILWQLFTHKNYFNEKVSNNILWKAITWDRYNNKDYEFRIFYLLYANVKKQGNVERSLFPLYQYSHQQNGNKSLALLFYFYTSSRRKIPETKEYYQEQRIFWFIRVRSNYKVLKAKGIKESLIKQ